MNKLSFILDLIQGDEVVVANLFETDDWFGQPIASAEGSTPDIAVAALFATITIGFPEEES